MQTLAMNGITPNCAISARSSYSARRIAPVAAISRVQASGARPAIETLRPARYRLESDIIDMEPVLPAGAPVAAFLTQLIGQAEHVPADPRVASSRYMAADDLGQMPQSIVIATL